MIPLIGGGAMRSTAVRAPRTAPDRSGAEITPEAIRAYLDTLSGRGRRRGTIQVYAARLEALYAGLPPDKRISPGTLAAWQETLLAQGYSPGTVNTHLSAANGLLDYLGRRDLQLVGQLEPEPAVRPELTRAEYLRLLQAARSLEKERTYLLVKVFALLGLPVGELPRRAERPRRECAGTAHSGMRPSPGVWSRSCGRISAGAACCQALCL